MPGLKKTVLRMYEVTHREEKKKRRNEALFWSLLLTTFLLNSFLTTKGIHTSNYRLLESALSGLVVLSLYVSLRTA